MPLLTRKKLLLAKIDVVPLGADTQLELYAQDLVLSFLSSTLVRYGCQVHVPYHTVVSGTKVLLVISVFFCQLDICYWE